MHYRVLWEPKLRLSLRQWLVRVPCAHTNLSLSYLRKALMTLMVEGSEGFWNSRVFFSTRSFRSAPMAPPLGFLEEKDKEKLIIPQKTSLQTMLNGLPQEGATHNLCTEIGQYL